MSAQEKEQSVIWVPKLAQRLLHFGYDASTAGICVLQIELMLQMLHIAPYLTGDAAVYENPELYFDLIEINLDELEPHLNGPLRQIWQRQFQKKKRKPLKQLAFKKLK
jgi:aconitate hydratase